MASNQEIQNRVLAEFYEQENDGFLYSHYLWRQAVSEYNGKWDDAEANEIEFAIQTAGEDGLLQMDGSTAQIGARGLEQLDNSGYDTNLDEDVQESILNILLAHKRENPGSLGMSRDDLIENIDKDREIVSENVWYLDQNNYVDADTSRGSSAYHSVEITGMGRRAIQR